jgi:hypothetical protein
MKYLSKKISHLFFVVACVMAFCFWGCEKIDSPYYTTDPEPIGNDTIPLFADSVKKVLVEDYTGIRCNNCPAAARLAEGIAEGSRTRVIVMGVHAGHLAQPISSYPLDLRCPEGVTYFTDFNFDATPVGLINRSQKSAGNYQYSAPEWANAIHAELQKPLTFKLKVEGSLTDDGTVINAKITYTATETVTTNYNLLVFLVEDGIVGKQSDKEDPRGFVPDYVFRNVLRETLHGNPYGIPIEKPVAGVENTHEFNNYKIKSIDKKAENSTYKLIVTITQRDSRYIEQVEEIEL